MADFQSDKLSFTQVNKVTEQSLII